MLILFLCYNNNNNNNNNNNRAVRHGVGIILFITPLLHRIW